MTRPRLIPVSFLLLTFIVAFFLFLLATKNGIGVLPDSITYFSTANNLASGNGFYAINEPMTHYPPLYPIFLTLGEFLSNDSVAFSRFLHATIYSINTVLFGYIIFLTTHKNYLAMLLGSAIFVFSNSVLTAHVFALSEPLFITFTLFTTLFLFFYFQSAKHIFLILTALALSMAILTRYFGVSLIPPALLTLFIFDRKPLKKKIIDQLAVAGIAIFPVSAWIIRNTILTQSAVNRTLESYLIETQKLVSFIDIFHFFFWVNDVPFWRDTFEIVILFGLVSFIVLAIFHEKKNGILVDVSTQVNVVFGLKFTFFYVVLLIFSISFVDPNTPVDVRLLIPVFLVFVISLFTAFFEFFRIKKIRLPYLLFSLAIVLMVMHNIPIFRTDLINYSYGIGYNSPAFKNSQTIKLIKRIDMDIPFYSNAPDFFYFWTGIWGKGFPVKVSGSELVNNNEFKNSIIAMCDEAEKNNALIVVFTPIARWYHPTVQEIIENCEIPILYQFNDGTIFGDLD